MDAAIHFIKLGDRKGTNIGGLLQLLCGVRNS